MLYSRRGGGVAAATESRARADRSTTLSALVIAAAASRSARSASSTRRSKKKRCRLRSVVSRANWWPLRTRSSTATAVGEPARVSRSSDEPCLRRESNLGRRAGGAPMNVQSSGACGRPSPREVAPPPTLPDAAAPPWAHCVPRSGGKTRPTSRPREPRPRETQRRRTPLQQEPSVSHQARLSEETDRILSLIHI